MNLRHFIPTNQTKADYLIPVMVVLAQDTHTHVNMWPMQRRSETLDGRSNIIPTTNHRNILAHRE